jgi:hypothetical protein
MEMIHHDQFGSAFEARNLFVAKVIMLSPEMLGKV